VRPHSRLDVLGAIVELGIVPIFTARDPDTAFGVVRAAATAGARVVEFTNRGADAYEVFRLLARRTRQELPDAILGAGTIVDAPTAGLFIAAGAEFIVGPTLSADVARLCNRRRVAYLPGCFTPTEISDAEELGCEIVKLFPHAAIDVPAYIRSVHGPMPASRIVPTGVAAERDRIQAYIRAGATAIGIGPGVVQPAEDALRDGEERLSARLGELLDWVREAREPSALPGDG
jgi:2-dehydro-3-deoxyphosphogluconate aldolase/(4S)-4-hydroxy-2-oxoglutarate aldolase